MAFTDEQWKRAKGYFEAGLSLSQIKDKTGIARNTVSQRAKKEQWEQGKNADYVKAREIVAEKKGTILEQEGTTVLNAIDEVADDKIRRKSLVYGVAEKALKELENAMMNKKPFEKISIGDNGGQKLIPVEYGSADYKNFVEAIDKASLTLGVNERHAKPQTITQTTQQGVKVIGFGEI